MSHFVVSGEREGNAKAITLQRQSDGVKSIAAVPMLGRNMTPGAFTGRSDWQIR